MNRIENEIALKEEMENNDKLLLVKEVRYLTNDTYVLSLDRKNIAFLPGQYMTVGLAGSNEMREYSIYSSNKSSRLEFLIKEVEDGDVSKQLKNVKPGDYVEVDGPFGFFAIDQKTLSGKKHLFIASGTGISPFHSFAKSYDNLEYTILHGIRKSEDKYEWEDYDKNKYIACTSRENKGDFNGRVTEYLKQHPVDKETLCYLCGNSNMIYDAFDILRNRGVPSGNVHMEVYF